MKKKPQITNDELIREKKDVLYVISLYFRKV